MGTVIDFDGQPSREGVLEMRRQLRQLEIDRDMEIYRVLVDSTDDEILRLLAEKKEEDPITIADALGMRSEDLNGLLSEILPIVMSHTTLIQDQYLRFLELLRERARTVEDIGTYKFDNDLPIHDPTKEDSHTFELIRKHPKQESLIRSLFPILYTYFRRRQERAYRDNGEGGEQGREY